MTNVANRTQPHSIDAERAVLGAILLRSEVFSTAAVVVQPTDFFRDAHRRLFEHMTRLFEQNVPIDFLTVKESLTRTNELDEVGGPVYISALTDGLPHSMNVKHYAEIVREKSRLRSVIYASNKTIDDAYDAEKAASKIVADALREFSTSMAVSSKGPVRIDVAVNAYVDALDNNALAQPIQTGLIDVDSIIGGFRPGDLTIIAARPSVGKTSFAMTVADHIARDGFAVLYCSLQDESQDSMTARAISMRARVSAQSIERKTATQDEWARFGQVLTEFDIPFFVDDSSSSLIELIAWIRRMKTEHDLQVVMLDYIQQLAPDEKGRSREEDVSQVSKALKALARELSVAIVALSQLKRASDDRRDKRPHLSDLRESGALEQDADCALLLFREEMHNPKPDNSGVAECIIAKQRRGATGVAKLAFDKNTSSFRNLAYM
jgi:replicative DNA helicase